MRKFLPLLVTLISTSFSVFSQTCTTASLNWDALEYFSTAGYTGYASTATMSPSQVFAFGKTRLTVAYSGTGFTTAGRTATHTGSTGSYGAGDDLEFSANGVITLTFDAPVSGLKFSLYDIDDAQKATFTATNAGVAQNITLSKLTGSILTLNNNSGTSPDATASGSKVQSSAVTGTVNVDIATAVTKVTITITNSSSGGGSDNTFWLSDIEGCVTGAFASSYYAVSQPFTGMPGYVLVAANKGVYMVDPATGKAKLIFTDGATSGTINSLAYDPVNKIAYYCWSLTNNGSANASEKTLRKYDFKTGTSTTVVTDVNSIGIPTFDQGVESGAAAFYDGALYLGIEGGADNGNGGNKTTTTRKSIIWRMDMSSTGVPSNISQVYAVAGDSHDWSDFSVNDGTLYDFNGDATTPDYHHYSLQTGVNTLVAYSGTTPKQSAVGWNGTVYWVGSGIATYNLNGTIGTQAAITSTPAIPNFGTSGAPSFGDAAEAFRPAVDFSDAPSSYDPVALAPAVHEVISTLSLGSTVDVEWDKPTPGTLADADGSDEDALTSTTILVNNANYQTDIKVYNNTGANATVCAWIDFNNDGVFQASEGITRTVATGTTVQTINLFWATPSTTIASNSYAYLRIRVTSAANGMTTANPTGYFSDGEVEDYRILVTNTPLAVKLQSFAAVLSKTGVVAINWAVTGEEAGTRYTVQQSADSRNWSPVTVRTATTKNSVAAYETTDVAPLEGTRYYRLLVEPPTGALMYSDIKRLQTVRQSLSIAPNPARDEAFLQFSSEKEYAGWLLCRDFSGRMLLQKKVRISKGVNQVSLPVSELTAGLYGIELATPDGVYYQKLVVNR